VDALILDRHSHSAAFAISISLRAAFSGSLNDVGSMYLTGLMLGCDVRDVDQGILEAMAIEDLAAGASHQGVRFLRQKFLASLPHRIFSSGPILLVTPRLKVSLGSFRQKNLPGFLEIGAGLLEGRGGVGLMFPWVRARQLHSHGSVSCGLPVRSATVPT
jgi:hypothetical protein